MTRRIPDIDVVRGLALAGLPLVNLALTFGDGFPAPDPLSSFIYDNLVYQRFLTIFCFLFGVSFALILESASRRAPRPRLLLVRRLAALFAIGVFQALALDGNLQLAVYAVLGLAALLPLSYLPRRYVLLAGLVLVAASMPITELDPQSHGSPVKVLLEWSGLLALGYSSVRYGLHTGLARHGRRLLVCLTAATALAAISIVVQPDTGTIPGAVLAEAGLLATSAAYVLGTLLLLRTRAAAALTAFLAPIGRMALTCFLTQAAAAVAFAALADVQDWNYAALTFGGTAILITAQSLACTLWLSHFRYGPVEWTWRCATELKPVPMRREHPARAVG